MYGYICVSSNTAPYPGRFVVYGKDVSSMLGLAAEAAVQAAGQLASLENGQRALAARLLTWVFMGGVKPQGMVTEELRLVVRNAVLTYVACG